MLKYTWPLSSNIYRVEKSKKTESSRHSYSLSWRQNQCARLSNEGTTGSCNIRIYIYPYRYNDGRIVEYSFTKQ